MAWGLYPLYENLWRGWHAAGRAIVAKRMRTFPDFMQAYPNDVASADRKVGQGRLLPSDLTGKTDPERDRRSIPRSGFGAASHKQPPVPAAAFSSRPATCRSDSVLQDGPRPTNRLILLVLRPRCVSRPDPRH